MYDTRYVANLLLCLREDVYEIHDVPTMLFTRFMAIDAYDARKATDAHDAHTAHEAHEAHEAI